MDSQNQNKKTAVGTSLVCLLLCSAVSLSLAGVAEAALRGAATPTTRVATATPPEQTEQLYIVELKQAPALGNPAVVGKSAVRAGLLAGSVTDTKFDPDSSITRDYVQRLETRQQAVLDSLSLGRQKVHAYQYTFNGFSAILTPAQAQQVRLHKQVRNVWPDRRRRVSTSDSPAFLGLLDSDNGLRTREGLLGDDIIIGVIDSGITPQHPSFSERAASREKPRICRSEWAENSLLGLWLCRRFNKPGPVMYDSVPERWRGACETGENFTADDCNRKLLGARFYNEGFLLDDRFELDANEFASPADADGHGTHIASIAAGNQVEADIFGRTIGRISGVAPRARVAVYKACWLEPGAFRATCSESDLLAAIDDAVADGVDIINYSVGSLDDSLTDKDDIALLRAAEAGVLSVVATGNDGPQMATMQAPATTPWVLSVAASSRSGTRVAEALRVVSPESVAADYESKEAAFTPLLRNVGPVIEELVLVDDGRITTPEGDAGSRIDGCDELINTTEIANKIAFIQRGGCDFRDKLVNAQNAGAIAVVVFSNDNPLQVMVGNDQGISIPAVMIGQADGQLLRDRLAADETVELRLDKDLFIDLRETGNIMGTFSGRGPSLAEPNFLKPDVSAPGVRILGGHSPDVANGFRGELYQYLSGTSQSAPHVAGAAALIKQAQPDWSPAEIKSALMTTARQNILKEADGENADPFDIGAGHIVPNSTIDPGLLYPTDVREYDSYLCNRGLERITTMECGQLIAEGFDRDAADVNLPSIALTELVATTAVTRTVRNPGATASFTVEIDAPEGVDVAVTPASITVGGGATQDFSVEFSAEGAALNEWLFGSYTWVSDTHRVYSPFAVQPTALSFSEDVAGNSSSGLTEIEVNFGYNGNYSAAAIGLELPCVLPDNNLSDDICSNSQPALVFGTPIIGYEFFDDDELPLSITRFSIARDSATIAQSERDFYVRIALFDELTDGNDDLDLYVWDCIDEIPEGEPDGTCESIELIGFSQNDGTSNEAFEDFEANSRRSGTYIVDVHGFTVDTTDAESATRFCLLGWALGPDSDAGNLALTNVPANATYGSSASFSASWDNLDDGLWLGGVQHFQDATDVGFTLADINVNGLPTQDPQNFACP